MHGLPIPPPREHGTETACYPPECRFLVFIDESHLLTDGRRSGARTRRFRLADSAKEALYDVECECRRCFNGVENTFSIVGVSAVPEAATYAGYGRFSGTANIRKEPFTVWTRGGFPQSLHY